MTLCRSFFFLRLPCVLAPSPVAVADVCVWLSWCLACACVWLLQVQAMQARTRGGCVALVSNSWLLRRARSCMYPALPPWLFVGNRDAALNLARLSALGVSHVVNAAEELVPPHPLRFVCHTVPLVDIGRSELVPHLHAVFGVLQECRAAGTAALVYCDSGCSRAPAVVIAYLVAVLGMPLVRAMASMAAAARHFAPLTLSPLLRLQLALLEVEVLGLSSVASVRDPVWNFPQWNAIKGNGLASMPDAQS